MSLLSFATAVCSDRNRSGQRGLLSRGVAFLGTADRRMAGARPAATAGRRHGAPVPRARIAAHRRGSVPLQRRHAVSGTGGTGAHARRSTGDLRRHRERQRPGISAARLVRRGLCRQDVLFALPLALATAGFRRHLRRCAARLVPRPGRSLRLRPGSAVLSVRRATVPQADLAPRENAASRHGRFRHRHFPRG